MVLPAVMGIALTSLPADKAGIGSGLILTIRQVGTGIGVAVLGSVLTGFYRSGVLSASQDKGLSSATLSSAQLNVTNGVNVAREQHSSLLLHIVQQAFTNSFALVLGMCAVLGAGCLLLACIALKNNRIASLLEGYFTMSTVHLSDFCLTLEVIAGKWTMAIVCTLQQNTLRFSALERALPNITQKSLTDTLRKLEQNGMIDRYIYPTVPPQVEYKLTPLGLELLKFCETMNTWAEKHHEEIARAQRAYARRMK